MPVGATMDLDLRDLDRGFSGIKLAARNMTPVWARLRSSMKDDQLAHWTDQTGGDGAWAPRAESTRRRHGRRRKIFSKRFAKGFSVVTTPSELAAVSKIPYAAAHQFGGPVGNNAVLPARPFLYLSEKFLGFAMPRIAEHLGKGWTRR